MHAWIRKGVAIIGVLGVLGFGALFAASYLDPGFVERIAKEAIRHEVQKKVTERVEDINPEFLSRHAERFIRDYEERVRLARQRLLDQVPQRVALVLAEMYKLDCGCRRKIETGISDWLHADVGNSAQMQERLNGLIRKQYMQTAEQLTREFRIFTGANTMVFALLLLAARFRKQAGVQLLPAAAILLVAAGSTAYPYVFNQDWLHTIVFGGYVGLAYLGWLSFAFALLLDLILNRARITSGVLSTIGSVSISPC